MKSIYLFPLLLILGLSSCVSLKEYEKLDVKISYMEKKLSRDKISINEFKTLTPKLQDSLNLVKMELERQKQ
jgi:hypothetical protein